MKQLLLIPAILLAGVCFGQNLALPYDSVTGRINYKQITELPSITQQVIFSNANRWLQKKYDAAIDTVLVMDDEQGQIIIKAVVPEALTLAGTEHKAYLEHLITINAKDGKCLMQVSDLRFKEYFEATEFSRAGWKEIPLEGIVLGAMNERFGEANSNAYKKFLIAEDISIRVIMESFEEFIVQANAERAMKEK